MVAADGGEPAPYDDAQPSDGKASLAKRGSVRRQSLQQSGRFVLLFYYFGVDIQFFYTAEEM